ncbi:MAG: universal stress protein [Burkholderiaceae bacterium]|nr:universal stress protein [Burkholderiaceae bacterium]
MAYETILVYLDKTARTNERIRIAANIALANNAHLVGASMIGISTSSFEAEESVHQAAEITHHVKFLQERTTQIVANFKTAVQQLGLPFGEGRAVDGENSSGIALQARYCDLTVIGQADAKDRTSEVEHDFPEYVVLNAGRPVLIVPKQGEFANVGKRVVISWDASREATRAVSDAIPLLKDADIVHVAIFNAESKPFGDQPGDDIALYLARHGIKVEVLPNREVRDIGRALLSLIEELSSDLLVMGCYGHSRFREKWLGGVTRTVLENMNVPVLMSH